MRDCRCRIGDVTPRIICERARNCNKCQHGSSNARFNSFAVKKKLTSELDTPLTSR